MGHALPATLRALSGPRGAAPVCQQAPFSMQALVSPWCAGLGTGARRPYIASVASPLGVKQAAPTEWHISLGSGWQSFHIGQSWPPAPHITVTEPR